MRIQRQSTSMTSFETLQVWTKVGLRWSGHAVWSTILTLSLMTTAGSGAVSYTHLTLTTNREV